MDTCSRDDDPSEIDRPRCSHWRTCHHRGCMEQRDPEPVLEPVGSPTVALDIELDLVGSMEVTLLAYAAALVGAIVVGFWFAVQLLHLPGFAHLIRSLAA